ncbi:MAG: class I SAM-dependent methyltransferase [Gaiellaceae bacterium]
MRRLTPGHIARGIAHRIPRRPFRPLLPYRPLRGFFRFWLSVVAADGDRGRAMRRLLELHQDTYKSADLGAIAYEGGVHAKHRLMRYHDFFVERVRPGERVLDVGCGRGELAYDLAERSGAVVVGIDNNPHHYEFARRRFEHPRLPILDGDVLELVPEEPFDVIVLSNVLEHFEDRVGLLRRLREATSARRFLIRVPIWKRDWMVPLRHELGLPHFSDAGHWTEYDEDGLRRELAEAGLEIGELQTVWGELWVEASTLDAG